MGAGSRGARSRASIGTASLTTARACAAADARAFAFAVGGGGHRVCAVGRSAREPDADEEKRIEQFGDWLESSAMDDEPEVAEAPRKKPRAGT